MSAGLILLIFLVIFLAGGISGHFFPYRYGYGYGYGHRGIGAIAVLIVIVAGLLSNGLI